VPEVGLNRDPETHELAQLACSSTRYGSTQSIVMSQATIFAHFVIEMALSNSQAAREPNELESKRSNIGNPKQKIQHRKPGYQSQIKPKFAWCI
jgi:hypothetical protein